MAAILPFLTCYDPPGSSEGTLDPVGLYQIAHAKIYALDYYKIMLCYGLDESVTLSTLHRAVTAVHSGV